MIIATHSGKFHADDVFGVALLQQLHPDAEIVRTRDEEVLSQADIVLDVGGVFDPATKRFDHHQLGSDKRPNGIVYSAFGLLWREFGVDFCEGNQEVFKRIDDRLVQGIDGIDNGQDLITLTDFRVKPLELSTIIGLFNPLTTVGSEDFDGQFRVAVQFATTILLRLKARIEDEVAAEQEFLSYYEQTPDKRYVVLDAYIPHGGIASKQSDLLYTVFPNAQGNWALQTVQVEKTRFESKKLLPKPWWGLRVEELAKITGVPDVVFCHKVGFICAAESKEGALALLQKALEA